MNNKILKNILLLGTEEDLLQLASIVTAKIRLNQEIEQLSERCKQRKEHRFSVQWSLEGGCNHDMNTEELRPLSAVIAAAIDEMILEELSTQNK